MPDKKTLKELILASKGKFFSIKFIKDNGDIRVANGKAFYRKALHGGDSTHKDSKSVPFIDRNKKDFISANADRVLAFRCGSIVYPKD